MATKTIKKENAEMNFNQGLETAKTMVKDVNGFILNTTEEVVDRAIVRSGDWQKVTEKALKGGLKLAENQQDLMFIALEAFKSQIKIGTNRMKALFN